MIAPYLRFWSCALLVLTLPGCGGVDYGYVCDQMLACIESSGDASLAGLGGSFKDLCQDSLEAQFDMLSGEEKASAEAEIESCKSKTGCEFMDCIGASGLGDVGGSAQNVCGDDWADTSEDCDGTDLWGEDCSGATSGAMPQGTLACSSDCTFDVSGCTQ